MISGVPLSVAAESFQDVAGVSAVMNMDMLLHYVEESEDVGCVGRTTVDC